jgi:hypothetical protein
MIAGELGIDVDLCGGHVVSGHCWCSQIEPGTSWVQRWSCAIGNLGSDGRVAAVVSA